MSPLWRKRLFLTLFTILFITLVGLFHPHPPINAAPSLNGAPSAEELIWSPDGKYVAFSGYDTSLETPIISVLNATTHDLYTHEARVRRLAWSPDSQYVAFSAFLQSNGSSDEYAIYVMRPDGTDLVNVTDDLVANIVQLRWSLDSRLIAFTTFRPHELYVVEADGENLVNLTPAEGLNDEALLRDWSLDSSQFAILAQLVRPPNQGNLGRETFLINLNQGDALNLAPDPAEQSVDFAWSPDGRHMAYIIKREDSARVVIADADGSNAITLTDGPFAEAHILAWSPDSTRLAFFDRSSPVNHLYVVNPDGSNLTGLTTAYPRTAYPSDDELLDGWGLAWSPTGTHLLAEFSDGYFQIASDGSNLQLVEDPFGVSYGRPTWSPDGAYIAFISPNYTGEDAYDPLRVFEVNSGYVETIANLTHFSSFAWSPDSQAIAVNQQGGHLTIYGLDGSVLFTINSALHGGPARLTIEGVTYSLQGDSAQAIASFDAAINLERNYALAYLGRAKEQMWLGNSLAAAEDYWRWIVLQTDGGKAQAIEERVEADEIVTLPMHFHLRYVIPVLDVRKGQILTVNAEPAGGGLVDPLLVILGPHGDALIADDDSGGDLKATIQDFVIPEDGNYQVILSHGGAGYTGTIEFSYTLENQ